MKMKRYNHSLKHYRLTSFDLGELVPTQWHIGNIGDTFRFKTSSLLRFAPMVAPVIHPCHVHIHHFAQPLRTLWPEFTTKFYAGIKHGDTAAEHPYIRRTSMGVGDLGDHLGVPPFTVSDPQRDLNAFPFRMYTDVLNNYYLNQFIDTEWPISTSAGQDTTTNAVAKARVRWKKDRFTLAQEQPLNGDDIYIPGSSSAPVVTNGEFPTFDSSTGNERNLSSFSDNTLKLSGANIGSNGTVYFGDESGLEVDLSSYAGTMDELQMAWALNKLLRKENYFGNDLVDVIRNLGIMPRDRSIQRPVYIGGGRETVTFSEVVQSSESGSTPLGELAGHGVAASESNYCTYFCDEPMIFMTFMFIRPINIYMDGQHKSLNYNSRYDYWYREFENVGMQPLTKREVYAKSATPNDPFGFEPPYEELRSYPSSVSGEMRDTLKKWHFGREFSSEPDLDSNFINCVPSPRPFADENAFQIRAMVYNDVVKKSFLKPEPNLIQF